MTVGPEWLEHWMAWACEVVSDIDHARRCDRIRSTARPDALRPDEVAADAPDLRWPGVVGEHYEPGGLLCISNVHTRFQSAGLKGAADLVSSTVEAHRSWSAGRLDDERWLTALRAMYRAGLSPGGWRVGSGYRAAWAQLGEDADTIAYVNAARCQWDGLNPPRALYDVCLRDLPLDPLLSILCPRLVLTTSAAVHERWSALDEVPVVYFHQLNGTLLRPVDLPGCESLAPGAKAGEWAVQLLGAGLSRTT